LHRSYAGATERLAGVNRQVANGTVALTFDDGPKPGSTDRVLDTLARLDVRATFFCVGKNARSHPALLRRIADEGHTIGSHSLTHPHPRETGLRSLAAEYAHGRAAVEDVLSRSVPLFRPPHGHLNPVSAALVRRLGLQPWLWSVDPTDWRPGIATAEITATATQAASGDVVLFHDWVEQPFGPAALDRSATVDSLPIVVAAVRRRGLTLVTVQQ
jgi:peptidoglycan/xylan/chitin deacetylase (PgdA/CDA1 family)